MDLEGLAQSFQCLQNLCSEGKSWSCLQGVDRDREGDTHKRTRTGQRERHPDHRDLFSAVSLFKVPGTFRPYINTC